MPKLNEDKPEARKRPTKGDIKRELISSLAVQGCSTKEICEKTGLAKVTVSRYLNVDEQCIRMINEKMKNIVEEGNKIVKEAYLSQINNLIEMASQDEDKNLKLRASTYLIEMVNGKPVQKKQVDADVKSTETIIEVSVEDLFGEEEKKSDE